jgi:hypothetical protein
VISRKVSKMTNNNSQRQAIEDMVDAMSSSFNDGQTQGIGKGEPFGAVPKAKMRTKMFRLTSKA